MLRSKFPQDNDYLEGPFEQHWKHYLKNNKGSLIEFEEKYRTEDAGKPSFSCK